jgi:hypothetical protein
MPNPPKHATLPELLAYARDNNITFDDAYKHFLEIGRIKKPEPLPPIPDGWTPPVVSFKFSPEAEARARALHSPEAVLAEARKEFEALMLEIARVRQCSFRPEDKVEATTFFFHSFAMTVNASGTGGDYDNGYTLIPIDAATIQIEATKFETLSPIAVGDDEMTVMIPVQIG